MAVVDEIRQSYIIHTAVPGQKAASTTRAAIVATSTPCTGVYVKPLSTNAVVVFLGNSTVTTANGLELQASHPGVFIPIDDASKLYVISASGTPAVTFIIYNG